jgi:hypothetical protein
MPLTKIQSLGITDGTIVNADINASAAITLAKLSGVNDAKAWVNFNGTGTIATRASFNVSSLTDVGTGDYTVNLTTALTDANGSVVGGGFYFSGFNSNGESIQCALSTSSAVRIKVGSTSAANDWNFVNIAVFR